MSARFDLVVTADAPNFTAEFRLLAPDGRQLAPNHRTDFRLISPSHKLGLFDLRNYIRLYVGREREPAAVAEIGVCIAEEVLGKEIFEKLWETKLQRTLRVQLPGAGETGNYLAAALARVPWEIAKPKADKPSLGERNVVVRIVHDIKTQPVHPVELAPDESLRVLFVLAEARGPRPLGARQERRELLRLFNREIYPCRRVVAHFLTHGVTRERLTDQIQRYNGYHVVHWSGHGHLNLLELSRPGGEPDYLSGAELLELFHDAGGFLPRLAFLSACHSGDILRMRDWNDFLAVAHGKEPDARQTNESEGDIKDLDLEEEPGFTGTAHALLHGGVPSVVAMRYAVGDDYARRLAVAFYRALLAHEHPKAAPAALTLARNALMNSKDQESARFRDCDHATPVLYGAEQPGLTLVEGRSPEASARDPRLRRIAELSVATHEHFVGRTWELASLGSDFIGSRRGKEVKPVSAITGLGGMGKTALVAEALDLWVSRFDRILLYQAKPNALDFKTMLWDIHVRLMYERGRYFEHVQQNLGDAIYRDADAGYPEADHLERLIRNLIRAMQDEAILLVLDNFETNLKPKPESVAGQAVHASQDPAWDTCLKTLAEELVDSPSRVLITSRWPLAALAGGAGHSVQLGPLLPSEAALYLRAHPALSRMVFGTDEQERGLAKRLLNASRFHPLLMDRLARLAASPQLRGQLFEALERLEKTMDFAGLPALFATLPGDTKEIGYFEDALKVSLDQLIHQAGPDARRLLWMIAIANEPLTLGLLESLWCGDDHEGNHLRERKLKPDTLAPAQARRGIGPLLRHLVSVGLVTEQRNGPEDKNPSLASHELVRERIRAWMAEPANDHERGGLTENAIRLGYAERLAAYFHWMRYQNMEVALGAGQEALVYCVQAGDWERLGSFASDLVAGMDDQRLLEEVIPHLRSAAETAPEGEPRWMCLGYLADALSKSGRPDSGLAYYEQAASAIRASAEAGGDGARDAWFKLAWITSHWANACGMISDWKAAREHRLESIEANKKAGASAVSIVGSELEALRIDIIEESDVEAIPKVEARLAQLRQWWARQRAGQPVPEAPDPERLARVFVAALDVSRVAAERQGDWTSVLSGLDEQLEVKRARGWPAEDIGATQHNRASTLMELGPSRFSEAREELEACLELFRNTPHMSRVVLSTLSALFYKQGDVPQAIALARRALSVAEELPDPDSRGESHHKLAIYLDGSGTSAVHTEAKRHELAGLMYHFIASLWPRVCTALENYAIVLRRARAAGTTPVVPSVEDVLADPSFAALAQWLRERQVDVKELQSVVDQLLERARQMAADAG